MKETRLVLTKLVTLPTDRVYVDIYEYEEVFPNYHVLLGTKQGGIEGRSVYVKDPTPGRIYLVDVLCTKKQFMSTKYKWDGNTVTYIE
jgi:hypothetical protein